MLERRIAGPHDYIIWPGGRQRNVGKTGLPGRFKHQDTLFGRWHRDVGSQMGGKAVNVNRTAVFAPAWAWPARQRRRFFAPSPRPALRKSRQAGTNAALVPRSSLMINDGDRRAIAG